MLLTPEAQTCRTHHVVTILELIVHQIPLRALQAFQLGGMERSNQKFDHDMHVSHARSAVYLVVITFRDSASQGILIVSTPTVTRRPFSLLGLASGVGNCGGGCITTTISVSLQSSTRNSSHVQQQCFRCSLLSCWQAFCLLLCCWPMAC